MATDSAHGDDNADVDNGADDADLIALEISSIGTSLLSNSLTVLLLEIFIKKDLDLLSISGSGSLSNSNF